MKKIFSMYKSYMLRAIVYKAASRAAAAACLCLLWQRFVSDGRFTIWEAPCFAVGAALLAWAWVCYLRLDGVRVEFIGRERLAARRARKRLHATHSIVDFADEKIVAFEELEPEERIFCSMAACLAVGLPMTLIGVGASIL